MRTYPLLIAGLILAVVVVSFTGCSVGIATQSLGDGQFFAPTSQTIRPGEQVRYDNSRGGAHNLIVGTNGTASAVPGAPSALSGGGLAFTGGETKDVTFPTAGTFPITCTLHHSMQATVTVLSS